MLHSSEDELGELVQCSCHEDSAINVLVAIAVIVSINDNAFDAGANDTAGVVGSAKFDIFDVQHATGAVLA